MKQLCMQHASQATILSLLLMLLIISHASARLIPSYQIGDSPQPKPGKITRQKDDFSSLMGLEGCEDEDVACQKRRMVAEAHLDYIYTEHHEP